MNVFYNDSKTDLKLRCDSCINSRLPQHYKRHISGPSCSCKHRYLWVSPIFEHYISLIHMGYSRPLTTFLVTKEFLFHRPALIFQPTENLRASDNQSTQCQKRIRSSWRNAHLL